jgi:hypothetical protein
VGAVGLRGAVEGGDGLLDELSAAERGDPGDGQLLRSR